MPLPFCTSTSGRSKPWRSTTKPWGYIEVTLDVILTGPTGIANEVLGQSLDELARPSRTLLDAVFKMVNAIGQGP